MSGEHDITTRAEFTDQVSSVALNRISRTIFLNGYGAAFQVMPDEISHRFFSVRSSRNGYELEEQINGLLVRKVWLNILVQKNLNNETYVANVYEA